MQKAFKHFIEDRLKLKTEDIVWNDKNPKSFQISPSIIFFVMFTTGARLLNFEKVEANLKILEDKYPSSNIIVGFIRYGQKNTDPISPPDNIKNNYETFSALWVKSEGIVDIWDDFVNISSD